MFLKNFKRGACCETILYKGSFERLFIFFIFGIKIIPFLVLNNLDVFIDEEKNELGTFKESLEEFLALVDTLRYEEILLI